MSFTMKVSAEFIALVKEEARKREMSVSAFVRHCIYEFINK